MCSSDLDDVATILRAYPRANVVVGGYTDSEGNEPANMELSKARAEAVADRLTADGIATDRVESEGHGSQKPASDNGTDSGRADNRRVTLEVDVK